MTPSTALRGLSLLGAGLALTAVSHAQLSEPGRPASSWADLSEDVPSLMLAPPDVAALLEEDAVNGPFPLRYGDVLSTSAGILDAGLWEQVADDESLVWRLRIESPGAYSLGVIFTEYQVPIGGQVFLYNDAGDVYGAYTDANNNVNGSLGIEPIKGDAVTIEYVQQAWVDEAPKLHVGQVTYDYKDVFNLLETTSETGGGAGPDGGCGLVGINCPEGSPYQTVKRSVMRTLAGGALCSAALLNNTAEDGTPFMLTANHCGNMVNGQFLFNYEQATCGVSSGPQSNTLSGASQLAASSTYDSQLYRLNSAPPSGWNPHWAGWDRTNGTSGPAATIGHGNGGPKNIAIDNSGASASGSDWQVFWHTGYIVGGNSGGPLFNGFQRVIGPACCVSNFSCGSQTAWYGRLDQFWNAFNLGQHLDPLGTGQLSLDGTSSPGGGGGQLSITSITPATIDALNVGTDQIVTINGTGFLPTTTIEVNGTALFGIPSPYTYVNSTTMTFDPPDPASLGLSVITVENGTQSAIGLQTVVENSTPALQAASGDDPVTLFSPGGLPLKCAGSVGDTFLILGSVSNQPTTVPGFFSVSIGNNFSNLFLLTQVVIENDGITDLNIPLGGIPPVTTFFVEGLTVDGAFTLPLPDSNTQEVFVLF